MGWVRQYGRGCIGRGLLGLDGGGLFGAEGVGRGGQSVSVTEKVEMCVTEGVVFGCVCLWVEMECWIHLTRILFPLFVRWSLSSLYILRLYRVDGNSWKKIWSGKKSCT